MAQHATRTSRPPSRYSEDRSTEESAQRSRSAQDSAPVWSPTLTAIVVVVFAFFSGLFAGQELLHRPQVVVAPAGASIPAEGLPGASTPANPGAGDATGATAGDTTLPAAEPPGAPAPGAGTLGTGASAVPPSGHDEASLRKAIDETNDPQRLMLLAKLFMEEQNNDLAIQAARKASGLDPSNPAAHALLALAFEGDPSRTTDAIAQLRKAMTLNPPAEVKVAIQKELDRLQGSSAGTHASPAGGSAGASSAAAVNGPGGGQVTPQSSGQ